MTHELEVFVDTLYKDLSGYVYGATAINSMWKQRFFEWPSERSKLLDWIEASKDNYNVYVAPSIFKERDAHKTAWKETNVVWAEIDGHFPEWGEIPRPSIIIQSGLPTHIHCYWRIEPTADFESVEQINRQLAYLLKADSSGYDCNQVLRPPSTHNHKRDLPVVPLIIDGAHPVYSLSDFEHLPKAPHLIVVPDLSVDSLIPVGEILEKYSVTTDFLDKLLQGASKGDRSTKLMKLGYVMASMGMDADEMMSLLHEADSTVGKFVGRSDQWVRLQEIITIAKHKYPNGFSVALVDNNQQGVTTLEDFQFISITDLLNKKVELTFIWDKLLTEKGLLLISGAPGVGKSQFTLDALYRMALKEPFLDTEMKLSQRVGYMSLEMGDMGLQAVVRQQLSKRSELERRKISDSLVISTLGEPVDLTNPKNQASLINSIKTLGLNGLVIDALSSTTLEGLSDEKAAKAVLGWIAHIRQSLGLFVWLIHHNRKATAGNERPTKLSDVHGAVYIAAQADTVLILWKSEKGELELIPVKTRYSDYDDGQHIHSLTRTPRLTFDSKLKVIEGIKTPPNMKDT